MPSLGSPSPQPRLTASVIVPVFNGVETLGAQLDALVAQELDGDWELIVVDNGSTDGTPDLARRSADRHPHLLVMEEQMPGAANARNAGIARSSGAVLLFCDADDVAAPGWLAAMVRRSATAALVGGWIDTSSLNPSRRPRPTRDGCVSHLGFLQSAPTANLAVRREVFDEIGGFRNLYLGAAGEDVDFCWRAQLSGFDLASEPEAVVAYRLRHGVRLRFTQAYGYGRAEAALYVRFRRAGAQRTRLRVLGAQQARHLGAMPRALRSPKFRERHAAWYGQRVGRLVGSVEHRVAFF